jgi:hypothetical protein
VVVAERPGSDCVELAMTVKPGGVNIRTVPGSVPLGNIVLVTGSLIGEVPAYCRVDVTYVPGVAIEVVPAAVPGEMVVWVITPEIDDVPVFSVEPVG